MRILMIGDIAWPSFYHLGDEAMTEYALDALRTRGINDVCLVAGHAETARRLYGCDAVSRIGFSTERGHAYNGQRRQETLDSVEAQVARDERIRQVVGAVEASDGVIVAGGGNLNSLFPHHIFERNTLTQLAQRMGKPYALTSQTIGPMLSADDAPLVSEMLSGAFAVGARDEHTRLGLDAFGVDEENGIEVIDDAYGLEARDHDREFVGRYTASPYVVASFSERNTGEVLSTSQYHELAAATCTQLADRMGTQVLLVPHAGNPRPDGPPKRDQISNSIIARLADDDRVIEMPMLEARKVVAITEKAELVIGSRYHPAVFAARATVPFVALAPDAYSSVRMRGAAANVGMADYVIDPMTWLDRFSDVVDNVVSNRAAIVDHLATARTSVLDDSDAWWDRLVDQLLDRSPSSSGRLRPVERFESGGTWVGRALHDMQSQELREHRDAEWQREIESVRAAVDSLARQRDELREQIDRLRQQQAADRRSIDQLTADARRRFRTVPIDRIVHGVRWRLRRLGRRLGVR